MPEPVPGSVGRRCGPVAELLRPRVRLLVVIGVLGVLDLLLPLAVPLLAGWIIDGPISTGDRIGLAGALVAVAALTICAALAARSMRITSGRLGYGAEHELRSVSLIHALRLPVEEIDGMGQGDVGQRCTRDPQIVRRYLSSGLVYYWSSWIHIGVVVVAVLVVDWALALAVGLVAVPTILISLGRRSRYSRITEHRATALAALADAAREQILGYSTARAFGASGWCEDRTRSAIRNVQRWSERRYRFLAWVWTAFQTVPSVGLIGVFLIGGHRVATGQLGVGSLISCIALSGSLAGPLSALSFAGPQFREMRFCLDRMTRLRDRYRQLRRSRPSLPAEPSALEVRELVLPTWGGFLRQRGSIGFTLEPGDWLGVAGPTGCGKTTLLSIIAGTAEPAGGVVLLGSAPISDIPIKRLRADVGLVYEDSMLFAGTIADNLQQPGAAVDQAVLREALAIARCEFVLRDPSGLRRELGERGEGVSGGQRQRLALARAIVARPKVLLLDNAFSALDVTTEARLWASLKAHLPHTIVVFTTNRPSALAGAPTVLTCDDDGRGSTTWRLVRRPDGSGHWAAGVEPTADDDHRGPIGEPESSRTRDHVPTDSATVDDEQRSSVLSSRARRHGVAMLRACVQGSLGACAAIVVLVVAESVALAAFPRLVQFGLDSALVGGATSTVIRWMCLTLALQTMSRYGYLILFGRVGSLIGAQLQSRVSAQLTLLDKQFVDRYQAGQYVSRMTRDPEVVTEFASESAEEVLSACFGIVAVLVAVTLLDPVTGLILVVASMPVAVLVRWFSVTSTRAYRAAGTVESRVTAYVVESIMGLRDLQITGLLSRRIRRFLGLSGAARDASRTAFSMMGTLRPGMRLIGYLTLCLVLAVGGVRVMQDAISLGTLTALVLYTRNFFAPMEQLGSFYNAFQSARSALERIAMLFVDRSAHVEPERTTAPRGTTGVEIHAVEFAYADQPSPVLHDVSLAVPAGQWVAIVGSTGSGKSTLAGLVAGFYSPDRGHVNVGIGTGDEQRLRRHLAYLEQRPFYFSGDVRENVVLGDETISDRAVDACLADLGRAGLLKPVRASDPIDGLSAGERQVVGLGRVLVRSPSVVVLDEFTSSLDEAREAAVFDQFREQMAGRTIVVIAHRLSVLNLVDRVVVLSRGRVVETGAPDVLLRDPSSHLSGLARSWTSTPETVAVRDGELR